MQPGALFADRYEIERVAGEGGMATVYRARDVETGEIVALKLLSTPGAEEVERFAREVSALAGLRHAGVVGYRAHGLFGEQSYLAMEWLEGETLASRLTRGPLSVAETADVARQVADALGAVHARGTIHRDIKPSNLFLCDGRADNIKLLDFGIVRLQVAPKAVTRAGFAIGTPGYMAPEQASGSPHVGPAADLFSLGCVLFECLAGRAAFEGEHLLAVLAKVLLQDPPSASDVRPDVPGGFAALISRMLAKKADERPAGASAVLRELEEIDWLDVQAPAVQRSSPPPPESISPALTRQEQRLVSVLVVGAELSTIAAPLARTSTMTGRVGLVPLIAEHGGHFAWLADGTLVATMTGGSAATDQAAQAALCALAVRDAFPGRPITIAMGRGNFEDERDSPMGEAIERAIGLLTTERAARPPADASAATPEPIPIDDLTAGLIDGRFEVELRPRPHLLRERRSDSEGLRLFLGKPTPCVGRERDLRVLEDLFDEAASEAVARAALVTAPAGIGKSRLRYELTQRLRSRAEIWIARGDPMRAGAAFGLLGQVVRQAARLHDDEPLEARRRAIVARVERHVEPERAARVAEFLGEMVGAPFPDEDSLHLRSARQDARLMGDQMQRAWVDFLDAECRARPVLLVLEDLHWGDRTTIDYVDTSLRLLRERPWMVLALARPEIHERFSGLWRARSLMEVRLDPLSRRACDRLVRAALGEKTSDQITARLWERSTGNPFFLEELLRAMAEDREEDAPQTVLAMLQSRLERLSPEERRVLRAGSVLGRCFWSGAVAALLGDGLGPSHLDELLATLEKGEWLVRNSTSTFQGESEHMFRHALVRDTAYAMLTDEDRRLGHKLAGEWLEAAGSTDAVLLAEHYARGGEPAGAVRWYRRAAELALEGNDLQAVIVRAELAVEHGAEGEALGALRLLQAVAYRWRGEQADARRCGLAAMELLPRGSARWVDAACEAGVAASTQGDLDTLAEIAAEIEGLLAGGKTTSSLIIAAARLSHRLLIGRRFEAADALLVELERGAPAALLRDPAALAWLLSVRAMRAFYADDAWTYLSLSRAAAERFEASGDERSLASARGSVGYGYMQLGRFEEAEQVLKQSIAASERLGLSPGHMQHNLGLVLSHLERHGEAIEVESLAIQGFSSGNDRRIEAIARLYLARILTSVGRLDDGESEARRAVEIIGGATERAYALATLAHVLARMGRAEEALLHAEAAMSWVRAAFGTIGEGEAFTRLVYAEALFANKDEAGARDVIAAARDRLLAQAKGIPDLDYSESFLSRIPEHARTLELARRWLDVTGL